MSCYENLKLKTSEFSALYDSHCQEMSGLSICLDSISPILENSRIIFTYG